MVPGALSAQLCNDLLDKVDDVISRVTFEKLNTLATQPDQMRRSIQLGATGNLYRRSMQEAAELLSSLGIHDMPILKPTLIVGQPGASEGIFHRDFGRHALSITFACRNKTMLWGVNSIIIKQPRCSGTVFDGGYCHASPEIPQGGQLVVLLHLYADDSITAKELLKTHQCILQSAGVSES